MHWLRLESCALPSALLTNALLIMPSRHHRQPGIPFFPIHKQTSDPGARIGNINKTYLIFSEIKQ
jgi:hypothetical protein